MSKNHPTLSTAAALAVALTLLASQAQAQEGQVLSPSDALRAAMEHSPTLKAAMLEVQSAELNIQQQEAAFTTQLSLDLGYTTTTTPQAGVNGAILGSNNNGTSVIEQDRLGGTLGLSRQFGLGTQLDLTLDLDRSLTQPEGVNNLDPNYGVNLRLQLTQPLLRGLGRGVNEANIRRAKVQHSGQEATQRRSASSLLLETLTAWWELWYAQEDLQIQQKALELAREQLSLGQQRVQAGTLAATELLPLQTEAASLEDNLQTSQARVQNQSLALCRLLGCERGAQVRAGDQLPSLPGPVRREDLLELAQRNAPALEELRATLQSAQVDVVVARDQNKIQLDGTAWVQSTGLSNELPSALEQFGVLEATGAYVGLRLTMPVDRKATQAALARARLSRDSAQLRYQAQLETLEQQINTRRQTLEAYYRRLDLATQTSELAQRSTQAQQERFQAGLGTALEVAQVLQQQRQAELKLARLRVDIQLEHLTLDDLTGELLQKQWTQR